MDAKANVIQAAFEGGQRLARRQKNIETAFTYGIPVRYQDLDDPNFKANIEQQFNTF